MDRIHCIECIAYNAWMEVGIKRGFLAHIDGGHCYFFYTLVERDKFVERYNGKYTWFRVPLSCKGGVTTNITIICDLSLQRTHTT